MKSFRTTEPCFESWPKTRGDPTKKPLFSLATRWLDNALADQPARELFFVNHSAQALDWVSNTSIGLFTSDDQVLATTPSSVRYEHVQPGGAVKIDEFDEFHDRDELIVNDVFLRSPEHGALSFRVAANGGQGDIVLLWEDGFVSPHCSMSHLSAAAGAKNA